MTRFLRVLTLLSTFACTSCYLIGLPTQRLANSVSFPFLMSPDDISIVVSAAGSDIAKYQSCLSAFKSTFDIGANLLSVCFIFRTVLSWYPSRDLRKLPYSLVVWPTESLLKPVRKLVPPAFGVDISAIIWIMILSFLHEILTGQQGVITMLLVKK